MKNALLILPMMLAACAPAETKPAAAPEAAKAPANPYAFEINIALTPRAVEKLAADKVKLVVEAAYFGLPATGPAPGVDDHSLDIGLGSDRLEVAPDTTHVTAPGTGFDPKRLADIKGAPEVMVTVYSAHAGAEENNLDCDLYQGPVSMAQQKPVEIHCDQLMIFPHTTEESPIANPLEQ